MFERRYATLSAVAVACLISATAQLPSYAQRFAQNHPRRAQVLRRDNHLNNKINNDRGQLGGHYGQLEHEDNSIHRQEQRDARVNGGFITKGQQRQLNHEENRLHRQVNHDYTGGAGSGGVGQPVGPAPVVPPVQ